jgi:lipid A disaccharide synthetase
METTRKEDEPYILEELYLFKRHHFEGIILVLIPKEVDRYEKSVVDCNWIGSCLSLQKSASSPKIDE